MFAIKRVHFPLYNQSIINSQRNYLHERFRCIQTIINNDNTDIRSILKDRINQAIHVSYGNISHNTDTTIIACNSEYGHYQCNIAMRLTKLLRKKPTDIAKTIVSNIDRSLYISTVDIAGPGFINFRLSEQYVQQTLQRAFYDNEHRVGIPLCNPKKRIVIDFSSPNIAKDMHVGHLRSTIIGDCLSRVLYFLGHDVIRVNHIGDWGTQFGMLIHYLKLEARETGVSTHTLVKSGGLVDVYKRARVRFDSDPNFERASRAEVVRLQSGDSESLKLWSEICQTSRQDFSEIYSLLGIEDLVERGESYYNDSLPGVVETLLECGVAEKSDGAVCVFDRGAKQPTPLLIQKSDGGYLYGTTDLAAVKHRCEVEKAERCLYVTDTSQSEHFRTVFSAAKRAGLAPPNVSLEHVPFGLVLGEDNKKIKSRAGESVRLRDLLDEAIERAKRDLISRQSEEHRWPDHKVDAVARAVGIGAVKYADLCMNREGNYKFSFDKMLSLSGNTAPYMLYAYVRVRGIQRRVQMESHVNDQLVGKDRELDLTFSTPEEMELAVSLTRFREVIEEVGDKLYPNRLCDYMFDLSQRFNIFYERCPILHVEEVSIRKSRLALCQLTADTLRLGLGLLGLETVEEL